jgi:hypothetical protein
MKALSAHGVTRRQSRRRVAAGRWVELMPGVVAPAGSEIDDVVRLSAAIAYVDHPAAVLAREAGLWGHRLSAAAGGPDRCPETIDVDVPYGVRRRSAGFVRVHQRPPRVPVWWGDLPVIDVQDLVIDAAGWLDPVDLRGLVIGAVGERGVDARALAAAARSWRGRGVGVLREAVEEVRLGALHRPRRDRRGAPRPSSTVASRPATDRDTSTCCGGRCAWASRSTGAAGTTTRGSGRPTSPG